MKIFTDVFTQDEVIADSFKISPIFDGFAIEAKAKYVFQNDFFGESQQSLAQKDEEKVIDIVNVFAYKELKIEENALMKRLEEYAKKVHEHLQKNKSDRVQAFQNGMQKMLAWVKENYQELSFYTTPQSQSEGLVIFAQRKEEDPTFIVMADGLREDKV